MHYEFLTPADRAEIAEAACMRLEREHYEQELQLDGHKAAAEAAQARADELDDLDEADEERVRADQTARGTAETVATTEEAMESIALTVEATRAKRDEALAEAESEADAAPEP